MKNIFNKVLVFFAAIFIFASFCYADNIVKDVRLGVKDKKTRIVFELSKESNPIMFTLVAPYRVVLDFDNTDFKFDPSKLIINKNSVVTNIRQGKFKGDVTRVVLDVNTPVKPSLFSIPPTNGYDHRLVLDLEPSFAMQKPSATIVRRDTEIAKTTGNLEVVKQPITKLELKPSPSIKTKKKYVLVMIDPGHGGVDPGAVSKSGHKEKDATLIIAKKIMNEINAMKGFKAMMTRSTDVYVPLRERVQKSQDANADLFISIHADSHTNREAHGASVYALSEVASDSEAARIAKLANEGDIVAGVAVETDDGFVRDILINMAQRETLNQSTFLGDQVLNQLSKVVSIKKKTVSYAGFVVLKSAEIPSILIETSYISNAKDEKNLFNSNFQSRLAKAVAGAVKEYAKVHIHF